MTRFTYTLALAGSVLSASTWRQAVSALTGTSSKAS